MTENSNITQNTSDVAGSTTSSDEMDRLQRIAAIYHSEALAGPNELYHIWLRDAVIPAAGGRTALEIGCGKGLWTEVLCARYGQVDVVDGSAELLEGISRRYGHLTRLTTHLALAEDFFSASAEKWHHMYMTFLLEHVEDVVGLLHLARNCIEADGMLFIAVPNADSVHRVLAVRAGLIPATNTLSANDIKVGHRRVYTRSLLRKHLEEAGFHVVKEEPIGLKPLTLAQLEAIPPSVIAALCASGDLVPDNAAYLATVAVP
jgi:2-polyprenyl-3-methyl-5-hydroxy-6-metoxy-1,4-benzoquinol methylase